MLRYRYKAKNTKGNIVRGVYNVDSETELRDILSDQGYYLISFKKVKESTSLFSSFEAIKIDDITNFCRQFGIMLRAGISIGKSLETLRNTTKNKSLKKILCEIYDNVLGGKNLSECFGKYPKVFPAFFINMTSIGEITGTLDTVMLKLADYYHKDAKVKRKAKSAMSYPIFLVCLVFVVLLVLSVFVMPMFEDLFGSFDAELPGITQMVINVSNFIKGNIFIIIGVVAAIIVLFLVTIRTKKGRFLFDDFKLKVPVLSKITKSVITSRFASGFSTLLHSGVPLVDAIDVMGRLLGNKSVEKKFEVCKSALRRGKKVSKSLDMVDIFPEMLIEMVSVGESTGQLETVLDVTSEYFEDQVDRDIKSVTSIIEPAMIMIVAGIVVVVLLSVFLPMIGLMDAIEQSAGA